MNTAVTVIAMWLFRVEWNEPQKEWRHASKTQTRWTFKMHPRMVRIYIALVIITPFIFIWKGAKGVWDAFTHKYKVEAWSSYVIYTDDEQRPSNWEAYLKF